MTNNLELLKNHLYKLIKEELEGGEEEKQAGPEKVLYDLVLEPANLQAALDALQNSKNYGMYAKNLTDRNEYNSIFGPSNPPQKTNAAWKDWDSMFPKPGASEDQIDSLLNKRLWKIKQIKSNNPEDWEKLKNVLGDKFKDYSIETGNDSFDEFVASLPSSELKFDNGIPFFGKSAGNYFLPKTKANSDRYTGVFKGDQYVVKGDKIIFPQKKNPFETKDYLTKVLKTIMGNAKLQYSISQQESEGQPATTSNAQGAVEKINFVKTFDTPELANKFKKLIPKDFASKTAIDGNKITVADITDSQKKNLILASQKFIESQPKKPMKESLKEQLSQVIREVLAEKKLTKSQLIARDKEEKDIKKKNPKMPEGEAYGIATKNVEKKKAVKEGETRVNSNTEDRISYLKHVLQHVWNMGKGNNMIDFDSMAGSTVSDLFGDNLDEARFPKGTDIGQKGSGFEKIEKSVEKKYIKSHTKPGEKPSTAVKQHAKTAGGNVAGNILKKVIKK